MAPWVGTSGYTLCDGEINYTYYRMPNEKILAGWNRETPDRFKLTLKAPKRITHDARLRDCEDLVGYTIRDKTASCKDVYIYFKHEETGTGPEFARQFVQAFGG